MPTNHYDVLGVRPDAPQTDIHEAFVSALKEFQANRDPAAEERLAAVRVAYDALKKRENRRAYNAKLGLPIPPERKFISDEEELEEIGPKNWVQIASHWVWIPRRWRPWFILAFFIIALLAFLRDVG